MKPISRRTFIGKSAIAAAAVPTFSGLILSSSKAQPIVGANDKIRVGLIGAGNQGRGVLSTFLGNAEVDCVVVCDVDDTRNSQSADMVQNARGKKPDLEKDFRRVIERKDLDAVIVGTPDHWHALPTIHACMAGKDVYVEKPLATSIDEGRAMLTAAQKHKRVVQMGTQWRSGERWRNAVDYVQSGQLGKIGLVRGWVYLDWLGNIGKPADAPVPAGVDYDMWLGPAPKRPFNPNRFHFNFRWFWDYAGGLMTDWGVHLMNIMLWAMGPTPPKSVYATGGKFVLDDNSETPDTQVAVYEFPSYTLIWEHKVGINNGLNGTPWGIAFVGGDGTLIINEHGWEVIPERKSKKFEPAKHLKSGPDERIPHVRNFLDCMKSRQAPAENLEIGHHVSTVAHLGNIALRTQDKIQWDAANEKVIGNRKADALVGVEYRKPWKLPYSKRS
jgi:predicted dehydrogenase